MSLDRRCRGGILDRRIWLAILPICNQSFLDSLGQRDTLPWCILSASSQNQPVVSE